MSDKFLFERYPNELHAAALIASATVYASRAAVQHSSEMGALLGSSHGSGNPAREVADFAKEILTAYLPQPPLSKSGSVGVE